MQKCTHGYLDECPIVEHRIRIQGHHRNATILNEDGSLNGGHTVLGMLVRSWHISYVVVVVAVVVEVVVVVQHGVERRLGAGLVAVLIVLYPRVPRRPRRIFTLLRRRRRRLW